MLVRGFHVLQQMLSLLELLLVRLQRLAVQLLTNVGAIVKEVEADQFAGEGGWVGVVEGTDGSGVVNHQTNEVGRLLQTHVGPGEVSQQDQGVMGGVLKQKSCQLPCKTVGGGVRLAEGRAFLTSPARQVIPELDRQMLTKEEGGSGAFALCWGGWEGGGCDS